MVGEQQSPGTNIMISGLDHIVMLCGAIEDGVLAYGALLGRDPDWRTHDPASVDTAIFQLDNMALELIAPAPGGPQTGKLHDRISQEGALQSLVFACQDIDALHHQLARRGLSPEPIEPGESRDLGSNRSRAWRRFRLDGASSAGVRLFLLQREEDDPLTAAPPNPSAAAALDHVVVNTRNPDRATAIYGARLGLRLALDRMFPQFDTRLLFFKAGDVTLEVAHRLSQGVGVEPDRLWGLIWRVWDIAAAHARMAATGLEVSGIRQGRRPGTYVFTVKSGTLGVPTLILSEEEASPAA